MVEPTNQQRELAAQELLLRACYGSLYKPGNTVSIPSVVDWSHALEAVNAALSSRSPDAEALAGWQPISIAPKDGTEVLIFADQTVLQARYAAEDDGTWENGHFGLGFGGEYGGDPTHWMALPLPPAPETPNEA